MVLSKQERKASGPIHSVSRRIAWLIIAINVLALDAGSSTLADDESIVLTPPGFGRPGLAKTASGADCGRVHITVRDRATNQLTPCRINVVGPDGDFYQPAPNRLSPYSLTGEWPKTGKGNRPGKGPFRYMGRSFYTTGETDVVVPAGTVRIEVWKGFQYQPLVRNVTIAAGQTIPVSVELARTTPMTAAGYYPGDPHLHFPRKSTDDDQIILDLLEAEDIQFGSVLAYNEPAGPYTGLMEAMDSPQLLGLGKSSVNRRGPISIASGQEYRSSTYGHLNLFWREDLVLNGQKANADNWPLYGQLSRETMQSGGFAVYAHGGYSQAIHADFAQKHVSAVELLQFGVYRGIELSGWYDILNVGYRFPCVGASDYPACRKLGDCQTYVTMDEQGGFAAWLKGAAEGRSFVTTGPLLLLEVDGERPGGIIRTTGTGPHAFRVKVRVKSHVAPVDAVQIIALGKVVFEQAVPADHRLGEWVELDRTIEAEHLFMDRGPGIRVGASRPLPDAGAHTRPGLSRHRRERPRLAARSLWAV